MSTADQGSAFTPEELAYWMEHESDTLVPNIIICATITAVFSTLFVILRFIGRFLQHRTWRPALNDWLVLAAWVFFIISDVCFAMLTPYGGGRHVIYITNPYMLQVFSILSEGFYGLSMGSLKLSLLSLYAAIFPQKNFRYLLWGVAVFIIGWSLTTFFGSILQCVPVEKAYIASLSGYCISYPKLSLTITVCNVITDFVIILLPIPLVLKLNTTQKKKLAIIATFTAGCSAVLVSIVRLVYALHVGSVDGSWTAIPAGYTSCVELTLGFLVVSIPAYRPLIMKQIRLSNGSTVWSWRASRRRGLLESSKYPYGSDGYNASGRKGSAPSGPQTDISTMELNSMRDKRSNSHDHGRGYTTVVVASEQNIPRLPSSGIHVTDQVEQTKMARNNSSWLRIGDEELGMPGRRA
ncbi:hypothetical protein J7T55_005698 [Diaporthe amygdali]|uniref:uncharacterized protein n=1 Tax=Phomopsis amygdali TaxID=1214568 RepID=UPI0022FE34EC|nr:uncharacterized protein J7T55_005698 [Diaporthe amygdali]KAJ0124360.1 hypothetical protein J7T55_005698 [Diaporthe amygdali]